MSAASLVSLLLLVPPPPRPAEPVGTAHVVPVAIASPARSEFAGAFTIRRNVAEVQLLVSVTDRQHRPVDGLSPLDFLVTDDDIPVPSLSDFRIATDLPLRLGLIIDASDSMERHFHDETVAAADFLSRVLRPGVDRAFVAGFGDDRIAESPLGQQPSLISAGSERATEGLTPLYDAIYDAAQNLAAVDSPRMLTRKALVVITDGDDTVSAHPLDDAIEMAQRYGVAVYCISFRDRRHPPVNDTLRQISAETGATAFLDTRPENIEAVFAALEDDMRTQYMLTYRAAPRGSAKFHRVRVTTRNRSLKVACRTGYFDQHTDSR